MDMKTYARFEARAKILKALAHPTRLFIVDELARGERCVYELTGMIGADISTVSKHLTVLKNAHVISDEKRGTQVFYTLTMPCAARFFTCVEDMLQTKIREHLDLAGEE